jgi:hypothetical protein
VSDERREADVRDDAAALFDTLMDEGRLGYAEARWVFTTLGGRRVPTPRVLALALARRRLPDVMAENPAASRRQLAVLLRRSVAHIADCGITHNTVMAWRKSMEREKLRLLSEKVVPSDRLRPETMKQ